MLQCKTKWKKKKLENLSEMQKGKLTAQGLFCNENWIKLLNTETLFSKIETYADTKNAVISTDKDVLILCDGERSGLVAKGQHGVVGSTFAKLSIDNSEIDSNYLYHFMNNKFTWIQNRRTGTGVPHIPKDLSHILEIEYPKDITEQKKFADILSTCDEVIEKTEETIEKYKQIKAGMMQDLFTRGLDANGKLRPTCTQSPDLYKYSKELDRYIPNEWSIKRLDEIGEMKSGEGITAKNIFITEEYPVYGGNGLRGYTNKYTHEGEYVLIGRQGALCGNINKVSGKFFASEHAVVVTLYDDNNVDWIFYKYTDLNLNQYSEASAQPGLSVQKISKIKIDIPKGNEQKNIAMRLNLIDKKIKLEEQYLNKYKKIKQGLMKRLLTPPADAEIVEE